MKVSIRFLLVLSFLPLTGCFEVLQMIDARRDGTIRMSLRVSVSKLLQKEEEKKEWRAPGAKDFLHDTHRIYSKIVSRELSDDVTIRRQFDFTTSRALLRNAHDEDRGMFLPYPDGDHQWVFLFPAVSLPEKQSGDVTTLLASATCKVFFRGAGQPRRAAFTGLDGKRLYLRVTAFGDSSMIDVPVSLLAGGGVLTTGAYWQIDFNRTDRLIAFLKSQGPAPFQITGEDGSDESEVTIDTKPVKKPSDNQTTRPTPNGDQPMIPSPGK